VPQVIACGSFDLGLEVAAEALEPQPELAIRVLDLGLEIAAEALEPQSELAVRALDPHFQSAVHVCRFLAEQQDITLGRQSISCRTADLNFDSAHDRACLPGRHVRLLEDFERFGLHGHYPSPPARRVNRGTSREYSGTV
jgi:hypothetical protein